MSFFPIINVPPGAAEIIEQLGTKPKFWFQEENLGWCLCKLTRPRTGEDWSEKVAAELADALGLPHARYELGLCGFEKCVVSPRFLPEVCALIHGNELLGRIDSSYRNTNVSRFHRTAHTLEAVWDALQQTACDLPLDWNPPAGIRNAAEAFVGYLLLDAFVGNTDRHDENWAIVQAPEEATARRHLAPTFDHASCLGCHLTDENRRARLATKDLGYTAEAYATKARSAFFPAKNAAQPMSTLDAFRRGAQKWPRAACVWKEKLRAVETEHLERILTSVPGDRCSENSAEFARRILMQNKNRVLAVANEQ